MLKILTIGMMMILPFAGSYAQSLKKAPDWVKQSPADGLYYYGIGIAQVDSQGKFREAAREKAIREIAEKLMVHVSSTSYLTSSATDDTYNYLLKSNIQSNTINNFEDLRLEADWTDRSSDTYYALYKLNKDQYEQSRSKYMDQVIGTASDYMAKAKDAYTIGQYDVSFSYLNESLLAILPDLNGQVELDYHTRLKAVELEIKQQLDEHLRSLRVVPSQASYQFNPISDHAERIIFHIYNGERQPIHQDLPLIIDEQRGDIFNSQFQYLSNGVALDLYGVLPDQAETVIQLRPKLPKILSQHYNAQNVSLLDQPLVINFVPIHLRVKSRELILGKNSKDQFLHGFFNDFLSHCSVFEGENAAYSMMIDSSVVPINSRISSKAVTFQMKLEIVDNKSGLLVLEKTLDGIHGFGPNYNAAIASAYNHFLETDSELMESIIEVLCSVKI